MRAFDENDNFDEGEGLQESENLRYFMTRRTLWNDDAV